VIAREWHAEATVSGAAEYTAYVREQLLPSLQRLRGFVALYLLRVATDTPTSDLTVITIWTSVDAVREFAGDDLARAVVEPEAQNMLTMFEDRVHLHEVAAMFHRGDQREISVPESRRKESDLQMGQ
jgi:heme-degrading monooxygenase HmoA